MTPYCETFYDECVSAQIRSGHSQYIKEAIHRAHLLINASPQDVEQIFTARTKQFEEIRRDRRTRSETNGSSKTGD